MSKRRGLLALLVLVLAAACGNEPGESVDRVSAAARAPESRHSHTVAPRGAGREGANRRRFRERLEDLRRDVNAATEDIEDLLEPVEEFVQFDECMYTVGMRIRGDDASGYQYLGRGGEMRHRAALSFDMRGLRLPEMSVMGFSGEEPPQIECNEDAGGLNTDE